MDRGFYLWKKKFFFSVFTRRICDLFTLLRFHTWNMSSITQRTVETGHWAHCSRTGNDNRRCAQHSGHFVTHFASSAATIPKPSLLSADSVYAIYFFLPSSRRSRNRFADESIGNKITYLWTDGHRETRPPGNLDICQVFLPSNFKLRPIVFFYFNFQRNFRILWRMFTDV